MNTLVSLFFTCLVVPTLGFFDIKSLFEKYKYYDENSQFMTKSYVWLQPVARLVAVATEEIKKGDLVLNVPADKVMTTFDEFEWSKHFENQSPEFIGSGILVHFKTSLDPTDRKDFINQFNSDIDAPGTWYDTEAKEWLQKYSEYPHRLSINYTGYDEFSNLIVSIPGVRELAWEERSYTWARTALTTYGIPITKKDWKTMKGLTPVSGDEKIQGIALIPYLDLYNNYVKPDKFHLNQYPIEFAQGSVKLHAQRDYKSGQEVYIPYGKLGNHELLNQRGITIENNSHDFLEVKERPSSLCEMTERGCIFYLSTTEINKNYLAFHKDKVNPELAYRQGVKKEIKKLKHSLRSQRRRLSILEDRFLKLTFQLGITEKLAAYKALALADRQILSKELKFLNLI